MIYTGIGARSTPDMYLGFMVFVGGELAKRNYTLRSGAADGADSAFERGCDLSNGKKEIFLPWQGFNKSQSEFYFISQKAYDLAKSFHPMWNKCNYVARKFHARNCYQVLGFDLETPTSFIICYTENGSGGGGTGQALRIAKHHNIPIFDLGKYKELPDLTEFLATLPLK